MRVNVYRGSKSRVLTLLLLADAPQNPDHLPASVREELEALEFWREANLNDGTLIGVNTREAARNLEAEGYHVESSIVTLEES
jgi:hypothetical protein